MAQTKICFADECSNPAKTRGLCGLHYQRLRKHGSPSVCNKGFVIRWIEQTALCHAGDDCLAWPFSRDRLGYGRIAARAYGYHGAHRLVCVLAHGEPPSIRHHAAHACGNGHLGCVNPKHLYWATAKQNARDSIGHETMPRGQANGRSKLAEDQVREIRRLLKVLSAPKIGRMFGVSHQTIYMIRDGTSWSWVK